MKQVLKYAGYILLLFIAGYMVWRFSFMIIWILIAMVISFIGQPIVRFFDHLHIKKWRIPHSLSAALALISIILIFFGLLAVFVPLIVHQAESISRIDVNRVEQNLQGPLQWIDDKLHTFGVIPFGITLQDFIVIKAKSVVTSGNVGTVLDDFFRIAGTALVSVISVFFIAFFFLKDENMFEETLLLFVPLKHHNATRKVIADSKGLLIRYFIGVLLEVISVISMITLGLWILGVENALLIGFFGGIMYIIPYLGPIIGSVIGIALGLTAMLAAGMYNDFFPILAKLFGVLYFAHFIDYNILIPVIYSKSVKAHPLEIFFVIIMGGSLAGITGMLLAIPVYTVLRVIAKEFFQQFRVVQKLTSKIS